MRRFPLALPAPTGLLPAVTRIKPADVRRHIWSIILAVSTALLVIVSLYTLLVEQPAFHFSARSYQALDGSVCPGGLVQWRDERIITRGNVTALIVTTLWDVEQGRTVQADRDPEGYVWLRPTQIVNDLSYLLPSSLVPGPYEIHVGNHRPRAGDGEAYYVPFEVIPCGP